MNQYLSNELYNEEVKLLFLEQYPEKTRVYYRYVLSKAYDTEMSMGNNGKDIYEMDNQELDLLLKAYCNGSLDAVASVHSVLKKYIDFAIVSGHVETKMNYLQGMGGKDLVKYIDQVSHVNKYITKEELQQIIGECVNAQDALCIAFPFYGVKGEECEEIVNLKITDVSRIKLELTLTKNSGETRIVKIDEFLLDLIDKALDETEYQKSNGDADAKMKVKAYKIYETDYVMRISARQSFGAINPVNIISRVNRIKSYWGNPYLTITSIWHSGMIHKAKEMKEKLGELQRQDWIEINRQFGYDEKYWGRTKARYESVENVNI